MDLDFEVSSDLSSSDVPHRLEHGPNLHALSQRHSLRILWSTVPNIATVSRFAYHTMCYKDTDWKLPAALMLISQFSGPLTQVWEVWLECRYVDNKQ